MQPMRRPRMNPRAAMRHSKDGRRPMVRTTSVFNSLWGDTRARNRKKSGGLGAEKPKQYLNANKYKGLGEEAGWGHSGGRAGASGGQQY